MTQGFSTEMYYLPGEDATIVLAANRADEDYKSQSADVLGVVATTLFLEYLKSG